MWKKFSSYLEPLLFIVVFKLVLNLHYDFRLNPIDICKTVSKNLKPRFSMFKIDMKVHISDICGLASFHPYFEQKGIMFKYTISYKQKHPNANR